MTHHKRLFRTRTALRIGAGVLLAIAAGKVSAAEATVFFGADAKTVSMPGSAVHDSPLATRLFLDRNFTVPAPPGTAIWFVADKNHDGVPPVTLGFPLVGLTSILGPDDVVIHRDIIAGDQPGAVAGCYRQTGIQITCSAAELPALQNANIYVYLWNANGTNFVPSPGESFGVLNLGVHPPPEFGNAFWGVAQNLSASQFNVVSAVQLVSGLVALDGFTGPAREVLFSATDGLTFTNRTLQMLPFAGGVASYTLAVPPGTARVSTKTAWSLRKSLSVSFISDSATANFTGGKTLPAGDLDESNKVDLADHCRLATAWYQQSAAVDLDGCGVVNADDYFLMAAHWNELGDSE